MKTILSMANQNSTSPYILMCDMPTTNVRMMNMTIHREELMSVQKLKRTQMAVISVGTDNRLPYTRL